VYHDLGTLNVTLVLSREQLAAFVARRLGPREPGQDD
jgi:hypothetical protein